MSYFRIEWFTDWISLKYIQNLLPPHTQQSANWSDQINQSSDLHKILEKSVSRLKWKMIEEVFERRKNDSRYVE
jgi:hypothetical protein